jgi:hypothetical protein
MKEMISKLQLMTQQGMNIKEKKPTIKVANHEVNDRN